MNSPAYFEIQADDPERAIGFYTAVFGWGFTKVTGLPIDYWRIQPEDMGGGLLKRPAIAPPPSKRHKRVRMLNASDRLRWNGKNNLETRRPSRTREVCRSWHLLAGLLP